MARDTVTEGPPARGDSGRPDVAPGGNPRALEAITLDFGNTLVPVPHRALRTVVERTAEQVCARCGPFPQELFLQVWAEERDRQFAEEVPEYREVNLDQRLVRVLARLRGFEAPPRERRWDDAAASLLSDPAEIAWSVDLYSRAFVDLIPAPAEVRPFLERLSRRYRLAILSNWPLAATIDRFAQTAGWEPWLTAIVVSQRVGTIKPHQDIFRVAEGLLGVEPGGILHVGDDWAADIVGAKEAGWRAAYLETVAGSSPLPESRPDDRVRPDLRLAALLDLEAALALVGW